jgi:hypothetical protein
MMPAIHDESTSFRLYAVSKCFPVLQFTRVNEKNTTSDLARNLQTSKANASWHAQFAATNLLPLMHLGNRPDPITDCNGSIVNGS